MDRQDHRRVFGLDNPGLLGGLFARKGNCEWQFGRLDEAIETVEKAIDLCEACGNSFNASYAYSLSQWAQVFKSNYNAVLALKEKVIRSHKKAFFLRSFVYSFCASSQAYRDMGLWHEAIRDGETALKAADEHSDASLSSFANWTISIAYCVKGDFTRAIEFADLAVRKASSPMDYQWSRNILAWVFCRAGQPENNLDYLAKAVR